VQARQNCSAAPVRRNIYANHHAVCLSCHLIITPSTVRVVLRVACRLGGPAEPFDSDRFYRDTFAPFCNAGGIALIAAGNGYEVNGVHQGRDVANPYGEGQ
jgi:hypothetical protein